MIRSLRTAGRVLAVCAVTLGTVPFGSAVRADAVRTDTKLGGFSVTVEATPLRVLLDDPELQIPHDPGTAVLEGDPNYTLASVAAGPNAHALTSSFWPGNLLGTGLAQVAEGAPAYPLKGEARYPDKPYDSAGVDGGQLSGVHAEGLVAIATADGTPANKPGQVMVGGATATSTATVTDKDIALGTANSALSDVNLLAGTIKIGAVKTVLTTSADGTRSSSSGTTTVSGLTIAGQEFSVDDKGLHAAGQGSALPPLDTPAEVTAALGISAHALNQVSSTTPRGVRRVAGGLIIDIDTGPLRKALSPVTAVVNPVVNGLIGNLPPEVASQLYYFVKATPHITFILASANSKSAATLPITLPAFQFPSFPATPGTFVNTPGSGSGITGGPPLPATIDPGGPVGTPPILGGDGGTGTAPVTSGTGKNAASSSPYAGSGGIGAGLLLGAFLGAGLIGWGLLRFLGLAGGALLGVGCRLGAPTSVPNLRSVTS